MIEPDSLTAPPPETPFTGSDGDYLLGKVSKVFPQLRSDVLG